VATIDPLAITPQPARAGGRRARHAGKNGLLVHVTR
jgi:hypothetical protein